MEQQLLAKLQGKAFGTFFLRLLIISIVVTLVIVWLINQRIVPADAGSALIGIGCLLTYSPIFRSLFNRRYGDENMGFYRLGFIAVDSNSGQTLSSFDSGKIEKLQSLGRLKESGVLTEEEFESQKKNLLKTL